VNSGEYAECQCHAQHGISAPADSLDGLCPGCRARSPSACARVHEHEAKQPTPQPMFPRFPADAVLIVDAHNGDEQWTGEEWNAYADRCEASRSEFIARLIGIVDHGEPQ